MRKLAHILVDQLNGHWSASLSGIPKTGYGGQTPAQALRRLIDATGIGLDGTEIIAMEEATRDGHLEFLVPYFDCWRIPEPSAN